jgi:predicted porin
MKAQKIILFFCFIATQAIADEQSQGEFCAKINVDAQSSDEGDDRFSEIKSNNSWIGVKGAYEINSGISVVYRLEWKVDITGESGSDS